MIITGNSFRFMEGVREFSFSKSFQLSNFTGTSYFGFSGDSDRLAFKFESGKVYDPEGRLAFTFNNDALNISGNIATGKYSYNINGVDVCTNGQKDNFVINKFFYEISEGNQATTNDFYIVTDSSNTTKLNFNFQSGDSETLLEKDFIPSNGVTAFLQDTGVSDAQTRIFSGNIFKPVNAFGVSGTPFSTNENIYDSRVDFGTFAITNTGDNTLNTNEVEVVLQTASGEYRKIVNLNKIQSESSLKIQSGVGTLTNNLSSSNPTGGDIIESLSLLAIKDIQTEVTISGVPTRTHKIEIPIKYNKVYEYTNTNVDLSGQNPLPNTGINLRFELFRTGSSGLSEMSFTDRDGYYEGDGSYTGKNGPFTIKTGNFFSNLSHLGFVGGLDGVYETFTMLDKRRVQSQTSASEFGGEGLVQVYNSTDTSNNPFRTVFGSDQSDLLVTIDYTDKAFIGDGYSSYTFRSGVKYADPEIVYRFSGEKVMITGKITTF
jgi:hypothetical protein